MDRDRESVIYRPRFSAWNLNTGKSLWSYDEGFRWRQASIYGVALDSPRQRVLVNYASMDPYQSEVFALDIHTGESSGLVLRHNSIIDWMAMQTGADELLFLAKGGGIAPDGSVSANDFMLRKFVLNSGERQDIHRAAIQLTYRHPSSWRSRLGECATVLNADFTQVALVHPRFIELIDPASPNQSAIQLSHEPHSFGVDRIISNSVGFSPDGMLIAAATDDGLVCIWNTATGEQAYEPLSHSSRIHRVRFSHDGRYLMATDLNKQMLVWALNPSRGTNHRLSFDDCPWDVDLDPASDRVAIGIMGRFGRSNRVVLVDLEKAQYLETRQFARSPRSPRLHYSPSGKWLAIANSNEVQLVDPAALQISYNVFKHESNVWTMAFGPDETMMATSEDHSHQVHLWEVNGSPEPKPQQTIAVTSKPPPYLLHGVTEVRLRKEKDHLHLHSLFLDQQLIYCLASNTWAGSQSRPFTREVGMDLDLSRDNQFAVTSAGREVRVAHVGMERIAETVIGLEEQASTAAIPPNNQTVAVGTVAGNLMLFSIGDPQTDDSVNLEPKDALWSVSHSQQVTDLTFSHDGTFLVSASLDGNARLWDTKTGKPLSDFLEHSFGLFETILTPDNERLITAARDGENYAQGEVAFWDLSLSSTNSAVWKDIALVQNGGLLTADGSFAKASNEDVINALARVNKAFNSNTEVSAEDQARWHEAMAEKGQASGNFAAERFHIREILAIDPDHELARLRLSEIDSISNPFPPRDPDAPDHLLDLTDFYRLRLDQDWEIEAYRGNNLSEFPLGLQTFGGTQFDVRGVVVLGAGNLPGDRPNRVVPVFAKTVEGIQVARKLEQIHFLHGGGGGTNEIGQKIATYDVHYSNGTEIKVPIIVGQNIFGWWDAPAELPDAEVAWSGQNPYNRVASRIRAIDGMVTVYKFTWKNPWPDLVVESIDFVSEVEHPAPWLLGITVDPVE